MTPEILIWFHNVRKLRPIVPGRVLEVGSQNVNGSVRQFFTDASEYVGIDMQKADGVDLVMNASRMLNHFGDSSFDTVICCEMLEHDINFFQTIQDIREMLKPSGYLFVTTPTFNFPLHRYPRDYWRFGEDAYREFLLKDLEILELDFLDDANSTRIYGTPPGCTIVSLAKK